MNYEWRMNYQTMHTYKRKKFNLEEYLLNYIPTNGKHVKCNVETHIPWAPDIRVKITLCFVRVWDKV